MLETSSPAKQDLQFSSWKEELSQAFRKQTELLEYLNIFDEDLLQTSSPQKNFPILVTPSIVAKMEHGNPDDPLLKQFLIDPKEHIYNMEYSEDPLEENNHTHSAGVIQKYSNRILILLKHACAVHCRYCFRKHFPYNQHHKTLEPLLIAIQEAAQNADVEEIIFSGGDPFLIEDTALLEVMDLIDTLPNVKRVRFHSRIPVVLPNRITQKFCSILQKSTKQLGVVIHSNHANELGSDTKLSLSKLHQVCNFLLNQSVLLAGINDDSNTLLKLSEKLISQKVTPYYLHMLDKTQGTAHFEVSEERAIELIEEMRIRSSGYLIPTLVREIPGKASKTPVF